MKKLLFPTEFGPLGAVAEDSVVYLCNTFGWQLELMHAVKESFLMTRYFQVESEDQKLKSAKQKLEETAESMQAVITPGVNPVFAKGIPESAILEAAKDEAVELIVFGTKGGESALSAVFGTAVNTVIRRGEVPTLTFREKPKQMGFANILVVLDPKLAATQHVAWAAYLGGPGSANVSFFVLAEEAEGSAHLDAVASVVTGAHLAVGEIHYNGPQAANPLDMMKYATAQGCDLMVALESATPESESDGTLSDHLVNLSRIPVLSCREDHRRPTMG
ncbi:MAG: universal stress protein [Bacteroidota bacterium]